MAYTTQPLQQKVATLRQAVCQPFILALVALWIFFTILETVTPHFFLHDDSASQFLDSFVHDYRVLTETGRLAEVNLYQYGGEPFLEQGQTAVLYPPVYFGVTLAKAGSSDVRWCIEWIAIGHLTVGMMGFYFWLRQGGVAPSLAAWGGLAWVFSPFILIVGSSWVMLSFLAAWLPWLFWAFERLLARPSYLSAFALGTFMGLLFLQGYVQWLLYTILFLSLYAVLRFVSAKDLKRGPVFYHLAIAAVVFLILVLPLLLPMAHATNASEARSVPLSMARALIYSVPKTDLIHALFFQFRPHLVFGTSSAIVYTPALLLFPLIGAWFLLAGERFRRRLFPLLLLSIFAVLFSSRWHVLLTLLPVFERFRWPFKVFIFADFFLLSSLVLTLASWGDRPMRLLGRPSRWAEACLATVVFLNLLVALTCHRGNTFSPVTLPSVENSLPPGIDFNSGRVVSVGEIPYAETGYRYMTYCYGTFFAVPCIGGYNPLVGREQLRFADGITFPNLYSGPISPEIRQHFAAHAVRYWIVDPVSSQAAEVSKLPGLKLISNGADRLIFEDTAAEPLAYSPTDPLTAYPVTYSGNSLLVKIDRPTESLEVSVGPTDGWWYRLDAGAWQRAPYQDDRLQVTVSPSTRQLEVSYFDPRFRDGLTGSSLLLLVLGLILTWDFKKQLLARRL